MWKIEKIVSKGAYNYAVVSGHPNATKHGYVLEHRVIVENILGRLLTSEEVVHHKDEDKKNNHPDNLIVMSKQEHARLHSETGRTFVELVCAHCGVEFERELRNTRKGYKNDFCSRSCNGKFQRLKQLGCTSTVF